MTAHTPPAGDGRARDVSDAEIPSGPAAVWPIAEEAMARAIYLIPEGERVPRPAILAARRALDHAAARPASGAPDQTGEVDRLPSAEEPRASGLRTLRPDEFDIGEMTAPTLKPCPFCGRRPITTCDVNDRTGIFVAKVVCFGRGCMASVTGTSRSQPEARENARQAWERRASEATNAALREDNERLRLGQEYLRTERDEALETLAAIHDFAHDRSTGPAVPDALWEVRYMAAAPGRAAGQPTAGDGAVSEEAAYGFSEGNIDMNRMYDEAMERVNAHQIANMPATIEDQVISGKRRVVYRSECSSLVAVIDEAAHYLAEHNHYEVRTRAESIHNAIHDLSGKLMEHEVALAQVEDQRGAERLRHALEACLRAHDTGRFEPKQIAYEAAKNLLEDLDTAPQRREDPATAAPRGCGAGTGEDRG